MAPQEGPERRRTMIPHSPTDYTNAEATESAALRRWLATMPLRTPPNGQQLANQTTILQRLEVDSAMHVPVHEPDDSPTVAAMRELFTSNRTGRANAHQQVSTVSASTPEANLVSAVVAIASAVTTTNMPGRPRKAAPDPVPQYEEVYNDEDIDGDYVDEDGGFNQNDDPDQVSLQSDEEQETLTRRMRSTTPPPRNRSQRSTRREIALRNYDEKLDDALKREKTRLKAHHSFMTKEVYEAPGKPGYAGPDPAFDDHWDADDEARLIQTYWQGTPLELMTSGPDFRSYPKILLVFKASLHVFKIDPLTLFTMGLNDIVFVSGSSSTTLIEGHVYMNPFWSNRFCERLTRIIFHPLWCGPEPWAFMLFAFKWAAICRTDDRRPLHQDDILLLERNYCEMRQDPTLSYAKIHAKEQRTMTLRGGVSSPQAQLLSEIATIATRSGECPSDKYYHVVVNDLKNIIHGLDTLRLTWEHDCEFFFQSVSDSLGKELYPTSREMPALYKNCYLSVERKRLYDSKAQGHDLVYFEEHHLRMPSKPPSKLVSAEPESEEQELDEDNPHQAHARKRKNTERDPRPSKAIRRE
ncbi:hypothetical protein BKA59DRAFT_455530 [Fusarium tricinctum]|uniref:Uncharacterized protein n=1 Tax=Fusarium tricinctum TaxID=61284 RepID=A0A8K0S274_9HYPO|nr:hypothetical protein BKA59DRAFT_455530 [Fusarium tricinctum]